VIRGCDIKNGVKKQILSAKKAQFESANWQHCLENSLNKELSRAFSLPCG